MIKWHGVQIQQRIRDGEQCLELLVSGHRSPEKSQRVPEMHRCWRSR